MALAATQIVSTTSHVHTYGEPEKLVFLASFGFYYTNEPKTSFLV